MQVVSGPIGRQKVHYEAPPAARVPEEMHRFVNWFEAPGDTDLSSSRGLHTSGSSPSTPSMTATGESHARSPTWRLRALKEAPSASTVCQRRSAGSVATITGYLSAPRRVGVDATGWQEWFLSCLRRAIDGSQETLSSVLTKARFWERFAQQSLNARQVKVLNTLLDGLDGKLTTSKWAKLTKSSQDTAYRDILDLIERGALRKDPGGGRSTSYSLVTGVERK